MEKEYKYGGGELTIKYDDSPETHKLVFDFLMQKFYQKYECFDSDSITQSDDPLINAAYVLAAIADAVFRCNYGD